MQTFLDALQNALAEELKSFEEIKLAHTAEMQNAEGDPEEAYKLELRLEHKSGVITGLRIARRLFKKGNDE